MPGVSSKPGRIDYNHHRPHTALGRLTPLP
ncbi:integrase core domain-containing protein [Hyphomonas sp.]